MHIGQRLRGNADGDLDIDKGFGPIGDRRLAREFLGGGGGLRRLAAGAGKQGADLIDLDEQATTLVAE